MSILNQNKDGSSEISTMMKVLFVFWGIAVVLFGLFIFDGQGHKSRTTAPLSSAEILITEEAILNKREGYWGPTTSNVDWCEENYLVTFFVAEFWNSLSSLAFVAVSIVGLIITRKYHSHEPSFYIGYLCTMMVGLGSFAFHGTLLRTTQVLDELPMCYLILCGIYIIETNECVSPDDAAIKTKGSSSNGSSASNGYFKNNQYQYDDSHHGSTRTDREKAAHRRTVVAFVLCSIGVAIILLEVMFPMEAAIIQIAFVVLTVYLIGRTVAQYRKYKEYAMARFFVELCVLFILLGAFSWVIEPRVCTRFGHLNLHAWWHIGGCLGVYCFCLYSMYLRLKLRGIEPKVVTFAPQHLLLPTVQHDLKVKV